MASLNMPSVGQRRGSAGLFAVVHSQNAVGSQLLRQSRAVISAALQSGRPSESSRMHPATRASRAARAIRTELLGNDDRFA